MVALSVNRPKIRKLITEFNEQLSATLVAWFQQIPRPSGISAEDASVRTRAVLAGLMNNAQFNARLGLGACTAFSGWRSWICWVSAPCICIVVASVTLNRISAKIPVRRSRAVRQAD